MGVYHRGLPIKLPIIADTIPCYNCSIMGPQNPILMIKAPILVCGLGLKGLWGITGFRHVFSGVCWRGFSCEVLRFDGSEFGIYSQGFHTCR